MSVNAVREAVIAFEKREIDISRLIAAACEEIDRHPEHRAAVIGEVASAFQSGEISARDLEEFMKALAEYRTSAARVRDVSLVSDVDADETVYAAPVEQERRLAQGTSPSVLRVSRTAAQATVAVTVAEPPRRKRNLEPGDVLNRRFELLEVVGEGGMGRVFRAKDRDQKNRIVALKVLSESFSVHPDSLAALRTEANRAIELSHDNIVNVRDYAEDKDGGHHYIVMEYLRGQSLEEYRKGKSGRGLTFEQCWPIIRDTAKALDYAHGKGIVHSDVKPSNIWITDNGTVKLLDFGIARAVDPDTQTKFQGIAALSVMYAALEQHEREDPDPRDDIYALACVTYQLVTGRHPFDGMSAVDAIAKGMSPARPQGLKFRQWKTLERSLAFERDARTVNVSEFLEGMAPEGKPSAWPRNLAIAVVSAAVVLGIVYVLAPGEPATLTEEERYVSRLLDEPVRAELDAAEVDELLDEGWAYVAWGREDFESEEFQRGNAQLKNGVSTAFRPFYQVIEGSRDVGKRQAAARGIVAIHEAYVDAVNRLVGEDRLKEALWLNCQGLSTPKGTDAPHWPDLVEVFGKLWEQQNGSAPGPIETSCDQALVPNSWSGTANLRSPYD